MFFNNSKWWDNNKKMIKKGVQTSVDVSHVVTHHSTKSPQNRLTSQFGMGYGVFDSVWTFVIYRYMTISPYMKMILKKKKEEEEYMILYAFMWNFYIFKKYIKIYGKYQNIGVFPIEKYEFLTFLNFEKYFKTKKIYNKNITFYLGTTPEYLIFFWKTKLFNLLIQNNKYQNITFLPGSRCANWYFRKFNSSNKVKGKMRYFDFREIINWMFKNTLFTLDWLLESTFEIFISSNEVKGKMWYFDFRQLIHRMSKYHVFPLDSLLGWSFEIFHFKQPSQGKNTIFWFSTINSTNIKISCFSLGSVAWMKFSIFSFQATKPR